MLAKTLAVCALLTAAVAGYFSWLSYNKIQTLKPASIARVVLSMQAEQQMLGTLKGKTRIEQNKIIENFFKENKTSLIRLSSASASNSACAILFEQSVTWGDTPIGHDYAALYQTNCQ